MLAPVFEETSKEYADKLKFAKISTEDHPNIASELMVAGIPCMILFNHGKEAGRIVGFMMKPQLKQKINAVLDKL